MQQKLGPSVYDSHLLHTVCLMKSVGCKSCGSQELYKDQGYFVCVYCQSRLMSEVEDYPQMMSIIDVHSDIQMLLKKCIEDSANRRRYASLILDIDPSNVEALKYLT